MFAPLMIIITAIGLLLQIGVMPQLLPFQIVPNIILVMTIFWLIFLELDFALLFATASGLMIDLFAPTFLGSSALVFIGMLLFLRFIADTYFPKDTLFASLVLTFLGTLFFETFLIILNLAAGQLRIADFQIEPTDFFGKVLPLTLIYNLVITLIMWKFFQRFSEFVRYFQHRSKNS